MIIILDGYNILKQILTHSHITEKERDAFGRLMGKYAQKKNHKIIIFFDGGPYEKPYECRLKGITVWYAGHTLTADDLIISHAPAYKNKDAALVTSDNGLISHTFPYIKTVFDPHFFYAQVKSAFESHHIDPETLTILKTTIDSSCELDKLMQEAALLPTTYKDENTNQVRHKPTTLSKKERSLEKHKKKL